MSSGVFCSDRFCSTRICLAVQGSPAHRLLHEILVVRVSSSATCMLDACYDAQSAHKNVDKERLSLVASLVFACCILYISIQRWVVLKVKRRRHACQQPFFLFLFSFFVFCLWRGKLL
ncbi:unnamed protein product [Sphagnum jensenii]|uniref:Uncharacterized protein n=1 Tax=Sphagnum jensenii TaxID=128206 RepID=A0ABP1AAG0_9BRYO